MFHIMMLLNNYQDIKKFENRELFFAIYKSILYRNNLAICNIRGNNFVEKNKFNRKGL